MYQYHDKFRIHYKSKIKINPLRTPLWINGYVQTTKNDSCL